MGITSTFEPKQDRVFPINGIFKEDGYQDLITFAESTKNVCVGVVDVVSSTKISARLSN